jgi:hypothetical protein
VGDGTEDEEGQRRPPPSQLAPVGGAPVRAPGQVLTTSTTRPRKTTTPAHAHRLDWVRLRRSKMRARIFSLCFFSLLNSWLKLVLMTVMGMANT